MSVLSLLSSFVIFTTASGSLFDNPIDTKYGKVQGYPAFNSTSDLSDVNFTNAKDIGVWKNIPFAATTGGKNRWKSPQPVQPWNGVRSARDFGPVCPSATDGSSSYTIDEDCLNLNIWSPAKTPNAKLPVVMWSYPALSTAADVYFDGAAMADQGVVYVNYNYRTGSFGWLAHPELSAEFEAVTGSNSSGNWGMLDQFAALRWIHENIAAFGGDPHHITVMGQSAGSAATQHIVNSPLTQGLVVGAIIESGVRDPHDPLCTSAAEAYNTLDFSLDQGVKYLASKNVTSIKDLRALPMDDLIESLSLMGTDVEWVFNPTLDYYAMPDTYYNTLVKGLGADVPILTGNTKDESGATYGLNITLAEYISEVNETYDGDWASRFLSAYPAHDSLTASGAYNSQFTDRSKVGTWIWAKLWASSKSSPVYTYIWDHAIPGLDEGAFHESEIPYVLNNLYAIDEIPWTTEDFVIARKMNTYWANFIKTGNPNGAGLVEWERSTSSQAIIQHTGDGWGSILAASKSKVRLFENWFHSLPAY